MSSSEENTSPGLRRDANQTGGTSVPSDVDGTPAVDPPLTTTGTAQGLGASAPASPGSEYGSSTAGTSGGAPTGTSGIGAGVPSSPGTGIPSSTVTQPPASYGTGGSEPSGTADTAKREAGDVAHTAKQEAGNVAATAKDEAGAVAHEAKTQLKDLYEQSQSELREQAAAQQRRVAEGLRSVSEELRSMAENSDQQGIAADVVRQVSTRAESVSSWLGDRDPGSLLNEVKSYARRSPGTFIAVAALAGLAAGRLTRALTDSAKEQGDEEGRIQGDRI